IKEHATAQLVFQRGLQRVVVRAHYVTPIADGTVIVVQPGTGTAPVPAKVIRCAETCWQTGSWFAVDGLSPEQFVPSRTDVIHFQGRLAQELSLHTPEVVVNVWVPNTFG